MTVTNSDRVSLSFISTVSDLNEEIIQKSLNKNYLNAVLSEIGKNVYFHKTFSPDKNCAGKKKYKRQHKIP